MFEHGLTTADLHAAVGMDGDGLHYLWAQDIGFIHQLIDASTWKNRPVPDPARSGVGIQGSPASRTRLPHPQV